MPLLTSTLASATLALVLSASPGAAPDQKDRHADIRRLMVLTGAGELGVQLGRQMLQTLRPLVPDAPESFWQEVSARMNPEELVEMVIPIYAKHLSADEVRRIIAFFESPAGRKLSQAQPVMLQEAMAAGQVWGQRIAEDIVRQARLRGFQIKEI